MANYTKVESFNCDLNNIVLTYFIDVYVMYYSDFLCVSLSLIFNIEQQEH